MISVIMPVYNSEKYVTKAIDSILNQTYKEFELILVNDGSTDNSLEVCNKFRELDSRVKVITKENGGLCSARNVGLDNAVGEYVAFIDNDDEFVQNYLEVAVSTLEKYGADIFRCNRKRIQIYDDGSTKTDVSGVPEYKEFPYVVNSNEFFSDYYQIKKSGAMYGIWNGVYRIGLFKDIRFNTSIKCGGEDWLLNLQLYNKAKKVVFVNDPLYIYYRRVRHSTSAQFNFNRIDAVVLVYEFEDKMLKEKLGSKNENLRRAMNAIYLVHTVKILEHLSCSLTKKEKYVYIKEMRAKRIFLQDIKTSFFKKPFKENICLWLYDHGHIRLVYSIIAKILKKRGNT